MASKLVTAATSYPVSLAQAKAQCRVDFDDDDDLIELFLKAAIEDAERFTGRAFMDQTWDLFIDAFPDEAFIAIPNPPLIEVTGVFYRDSAGDEQEFDAMNYAIDTAKEPARLYLTDGGSWPTPADQPNAGRIRFRAGFVDEDVSPVTGEVPAPIKAAILMTTATLYANRESVVIGQTATMLPWAAEQLLRPWRVHTAMA